MSEKSSFSLEKSCRKFSSPAWNPRQTCSHQDAWSSFRSQNLNSRFYVGTSDFFSEIQEKLVPKTFPSRCMVPLVWDHVTNEEYSSKIWIAAFTLKQVIFSLKSKKNLFPKLFRRDAWLHKENVTSESQRILEQNVNSRFYVGTSEFFHEIQEKLVPKTFLAAVTWLAMYTVPTAADRWRFDGFFESFFFYNLLRNYRSAYTLCNIFVR